MQANPCHVKMLFFFKKKKKKTVRGILQRKREPEGVYRVFYKTEPRGGSEVYAYWEGCRGTCKQDSCCLRPFMRAGKAYFFYTFSDILAAEYEDHIVQKKGF